MFMMRLHGGLLTLFVYLPCSLAMQPGAAKPIPGPLRDLDFGTINFLHTTDTHGWHAGHLLESSYGADWGDYISFTTRLKQKLESEGKDLIVVDTGDRIEGNGLYDASDPRGKYTFDIFKEQDIDLLCTGNHELYKNTSAEDDYRKLVPYYKNKYLASNLYMYDPSTGGLVPFANTHRIFTAKITGIRILAFGFLFDFTRNDKNTIVIPVEIAVIQHDFKTAVRESDVDLIVVIGHIALSSFEFELIHEAIRAIKPEIPIQFFGGHYHIRDYRIFDKRAQALASGRFMETIGFQSINNIAPNSTNENITFSRRYMDNNLFSLQYHSNTTSETFDTPRGLSVSHAITKARTELNLDQTFGCAAQDYWMSRAPYPHKDSVFTLLTDAVFPDIVNPVRQNKTRMILANTGAIRFDIFSGAFTRDSTYIVSPFTSELQYIKDVPFTLAKHILPILNGEDRPTLELMHSMARTEKFEFDLLHLPPIEQKYIKSDKKDRLLFGRVETGKRCISFHESASKTGSIEAGLINPDSSDTSQSDESHPPETHPAELLQQLLRLNTNPARHKPSDMKIIPGYTTIDDLGCDGDDTIHLPITFYDVPNCIQAIFPGTDSNIPPLSVYSSAQTEKANSVADSKPVDLLFNAFLQPYVLHLLNILPYLPTASSAPHYYVPDPWESGELEKVSPPEEEEVADTVTKRRIKFKLEMPNKADDDNVPKRKYTVGDIQNYVPGETFTTILASWIKTNWAKNCPEGTNLV